MGYQALLFCPDEKTARTVTQVLSELEFSVAACAEPFAAVKKLMSDHFDALVVDCDNEQNATLLFKSARNSTSNQTSLAVAVVEGQAGVAKAFRFGANLVLTKPINVEQAKGTLRVARGLLRKGEPGKPAAAGAPAPAAAAPAPAASTAPVPAKPATAKPPAAPTVAPTSASAPRPAMPVQAKPTVSSLPPRPVPAAPAAKLPVTNIPVSAANEPSGDDDLLGIGANDSTRASAASPSAPVVAADSHVAAPKKLTTWVPAVSAAADAKSALKTAASPSFGSGAASAPAPALEAPPVAEAAPATKEIDVLETPVEASASESQISHNPTTFTFGGAAVEEQSGGGSKKVFLGIAAAVLVAVGGYFGWNYYQSRASQTAAPVAVSHPAQPVQPAAQPAATQPAPAQTAPAPVAATTTPNSQPATQITTDSTPAKPADSSDSDDTEDQPVAPKAKKAAASTAPATKPDASASDAAKADVSKTAAAPLVVKSGKVSATAAAKSQAPADTPAPSALTIAVPGSSAPPLNLVGGNAAAPKPVLEKLSISQGVSQGLLIKKVSPVYPKSALTMRMEGSVQLLATISKTGEISSVKVISGDQQLTKAASDAVKQWKYKPYLLNGEPVEIQTQVTINFRLPN
jgi:TonB family protein